MNKKQWQKLVWIGVVMMLLAACGRAQAGGGDDGADTAVSQTETAETKPGTGELSVATEADSAGADDSDESGFSLANLLGLSDEKKAVRILTNEPLVAEFLADYPDWEAETWPEHDEGAIWGVDLYSEAADEWLGWGAVNVKTGEILEYFVPRDLSPEAFQSGLAQVEKLVLNDAAVQARLGDPELWEHETYYNRWDAVWEVWFWHGLDELMVTVYLDEEGAFLEEIVNPSQFEAEKEAELHRDQAIELAWEAEGIDQALDGVDNWHTLVAPQGDLWAVSFVADDQELFFALVDIGNQTIIETK